MLDGGCSRVQTGSFKQPRCFICFGSSTLNRPLQLPLLIGSLLAIGKNSLSGPTTRASNSMPPSRKGSCSEFRSDDGTPFADRVYRVFGAAEGSLRHSPIKTWTCRLLLSVSCSAASGSTYSSVNEALLTTVLVKKLEWWQYPIPTLSTCPLSSSTISLFSKFDGGNLFPEWISRPLTTLCKSRPVQYA